MSGTRKYKIKYRSEKRNEARRLKIKKTKPEDRAIPSFNSEHKPWTKAYAIDLAKHMLTYSTDFSFVKRITGLTIRDMLKLGLLEYYFPFTKKRVNPNPTSLQNATIDVPDTNVRWLRRKIDGNSGIGKSDDSGISNAQSDSK